MSYIKEQYNLAKLEGRYIVVRTSKVENSDEVISDFELRFDRKWFEIVEKTDNIIIGKMSVSTDRRIEICNHHDYIGDLSDRIPDIYIAAPTDDNQDYLVQKNGVIFTILKFPSLKGWFWEMYNCANYKANTKSGYAELWFCWRKNK